MRVPLRLLCAACFVLAVSTFFASVAVATPTTIPLPPFNQCPAVGLSPSCEILIVINQDRTVSVWQDTQVGPYDGSDDTLVGVENLSSQAVDAITVAGSGTGLSLLDGDGLCTFGVAGCPFGPTGYEGPGTTIVTAPSLPDEAEIDFTGSLATNHFTYLSLEGALNSAQLTARQGHLQGITITGNVSDYPLVRDPVTSAFVKLTLTVRDSAGLPIAGAKVSTVSPSTGKTITFTTNASGQVILVEPVLDHDLTLGFNAAAKGETASTQITLYHVAANAETCVYDGAPSKLNALAGVLQFLYPASGRTVVDAIANWIGAVDTVAGLKPSQEKTRVLGWTITGQGLSPLYELEIVVFNKSTGNTVGTSILYSRNVHLTVTKFGTTPLDAIAHQLGCGTLA